MDVTLRQLRTFLVLASVLNFRQAADQLFMTQQAVSASVKQLESQLGCALFVRSTRNVRLTDAGQHLYANMSPIIAELDVSLATTVKDFAEQLPSLQMSFPAGGAGELMPLIIDGIQKEFPNRGLQFNQSSWDTPTAGLDDGRCDVAILRLPMTNSRIQSIELFDEPVVLAMSRSNPLAQRDSISLSDALEVPVVLAQKADAGWEDFWLLGSKRVHPFTSGAVVEGFTEELEAIAADLGGGFFPALISRLYPRQDIKFLSIDGGPRSPLLLAWRSDHPDAHRFEAVAAYVLDHGSELIDQMKSPAR